MDIARIEYGYQSILPVGAVTKIRYLPKQGRQQQQGEQKESAFHTILKMQLQENQREETHSFQAYC
ncbi:MAG: hypothetical protein J6B28_05185 [Eubacterium sp.]|nr:hypothetical protein [Eubacterium sp.]